MGERPLTRIADLKRGDIIRHRGTGETYVIDATGGDRARAVTSVEVSNPGEWMLVDPERMG